VRINIYMPCACQGFDSSSSCSGFCNAKFLSLSSYVYRYVWPRLQEQFYAQRQEKIARNKASNRSEETATKEEMAHVMASGSDWEKVAKVCNLGQKGKDTQDRMRTVLVQVRVCTIPIIDR
jgi:hypothetical protein